ncbi:MAG: hypothetical protein B6I28_03285 [Fusobacteriia bacterium 4572_132]|nr:MAG: hypothetical protein B6I28_03285 [Fusobacteriia bacterium 4572_132]
MKFLNRIFLIIIILILGGCFDLFFDKTDPKINIENAIKVNGEWKIYYNDTTLKVKGNVEDNGEIRYMKNDGKEIALNNNKFEVVFSDDIKETLFETEDKGKNKTVKKLELVKDEILPIMKEVKINNNIYSEQLILGNSNSVNLVKIEILAIDENIIKEVKINNNICNYIEGKYKIELENKPLISNLEIEIKDYAGNTTNKTVELKYDDNKPQINKIMIDDLAYIENFKYNKKEITIDLDISDESTIKSLKVNNIEREYGKKIKEILNLGKNEIKLEIEDVYGNVQTKIINIEYIEEAEINKNGIINTEISDCIINNNIYYTKENNVELRFNIDKSNNLEIKEVKINNVLINKTGDKYTKNIELSSGKNTIQIKTLNEASIEKVEDIIIYSDNELPNSIELGEIEIKYIKEDEIKLEGLLEKINYKVTDNLELNMAETYFFNGIKKEKEETVVINNENQLEIKIKDYVGNERVYDIKVNKDNLVPIISLEIEEENEELEIINKTKIILPYNSTKDATEIKLNYSISDDKSGVKMVKYGETRLTSSSININLDDIKTIKVEDNVGNLNEIEIEKMIIEELKVEYNNASKVSEYLEEKYNVGSDESKISLITSSNSKIWLRNEEEPSGFQKSWEIDINNLTEGVNLIILKVKDENENMSEYMIKIYYDILIGNKLELKDPINITENSMTLLWNKLDIDCQFGLYIAKENEEYSEIPNKILNSYQEKAIITGLLDNTNYKIQLKTIGDNVRKIISNEIINSTKNKEPEEILLKDLTTFYDEEKLKIGFNLEWEKIKKNDEHDFKLYKIYRNGEMIKSIEDKEETTYVDEMGIENENKKYSYEVKILDLGGKESKAHKKEEYVYNLKPNLETMEIKEMDKIITFGNKYGVDDGNNKIQLNISFTEISDEINDIEYYEVYRTPAQKEKNEEVEASIFLFKYNVKTGLSENNIDTISNIELKSGKLNFEEKEINENYYYKYKVTVFDRDENIKKIVDKDEENSKETLMFQTNDLDPVAIDYDKINLELGENEGNKLLILNWEKPSNLNEEDFKGYYIYKDNEAQSIYEGDRINTTSYIDEDIELGKSYKYELKILDQQNNESDISFIELEISTEAAITITSGGGISN